MEKESVRKDSRKVGSERLDSTLSRFQKSGLTPFWVTLLPLENRFHTTTELGPDITASPSGMSPGRWFGHSAVTLELAEWVNTFLLSTG